VAIGLKSTILAFSKSLTASSIGERPSDRRKYRMRTPSSCCYRGRYFASFL